MRRIIILAAIIAMLILVVTSLRDIFISSRPEEEVEVETVMDSQTATQAGSQDNETSPSAKYLEHSRQNLIVDDSARRVLFFYANWCPTCIPADKDFSENVGKLPSDVVVIRVNYNDDQTDEAEKSLAKKYGVTYQHTFVQIDKNGKEVAKWNGEGVEKLLSNLK